VEKGNPEQRTGFRVKPGMTNVDYANGEFNCWQFHVRQFQTFAAEESGHLEKLESLYSD